MTSSTSSSPSCVAQLRAENTSLQEEHRLLQLQCDRIRRANDTSEAHLLGKNSGTSQRCHGPHPDLTADELNELHKLRERDSAITSLGKFCTAYLANQLPVTSPSSSSSDVLDDDTSKMMAAATALTSVRQQITELEAAIDTKKRRLVALEQNGKRQVERLRSELETVSRNLAAKRRENEKLAQDNARVKEEAQKLKNRHQSEERNRSTQIRDMTEQVFMLEKEAESLHVSIKLTIQRREALLENARRERERKQQLRDAKIASAAFLEDVQRDFNAVVRDTFELGGKHVLESEENARQGLVDEERAQRFVLEAFETVNRP
eukprot:PhM_4_TR8871/c0_g1_i1/m.1883